ncbi:MAG: DNA-directed RNA polymerase subunit omega [Alphaproteobacteria bacterium]|nr:DNA-directed RNA polymerase subunit omega [Alphaproteobacteria bacterium]
MARTTNSDTLPFVESRYELGMLASQRVRDLNGGATPVVERNGDKPTVTALREIASGKLDIPAIRHEFVQSYKETPVVENAEETLEVSSDNPELRDIDAELEETLIGDEPVDATELVAEDVMDDDTESDEE